LIPQSVSAGLQLGLGVLMAVLGLGLLLKLQWMGFGSLALLFVLMRIPRCPAAPLTLMAAIVVGLATHVVAWPETLSAEWRLPGLVLPSWPDLSRGLELAVLPQLPLTLTNAVIVTAILSRDLFGGQAARATERNFALSSGIANLLLSPFGAIPMCHGAGGLQAQYRFGARTGLAPILLGAVLLVLALGFADMATSLFAIVPIGAVGALLIMAGADLAVSRRLFDGWPSCWPVIGVTALVTLLVNPAVALAAGWLAELARAAIVRRATRGYS
jgi:MFS superfamily sulfate permease-like transporter